MINNIKVYEVCMMSVQQKHTQKLYNAFYVTFVNIYDSMQYGGNK